jgi:hypothetical protein
MSLSLRSAIQFTIKSTVNVQLAQYFTFFQVLSNFIFYENNLFSTARGFSFKASLNNEYSANI